MFKKISFLLAIGFIALNVGACASRVGGYGGGAMVMSGGYGGGYGQPYCPDGGRYDPDARQCMVHGAPMPDIADDLRCRGMAPGTTFTVEMQDQNGMPVFDRRVCGVPRRG